jgi:hypothetical protein
MNELTGEHFDELCRQGPVQAQIQGIEGNRKDALKQFWMRLGVCLAAAILLPVLMWEINEVVAIILFFLFFIGGLIWAWGPLDRARQALKLPVLEALAARGGMTYEPSNFEPPVFADACRTIFGSWLSSTTFTDLFYGRDQAGSNYAFYVAMLTRRVGKNTTTVFSGQIYALQRQRGGTGLTVILPDKGIFNFFKPGAGMERVHFEENAEFENRFEVYSTAPMEAKMLLGSRTVQDQLLEARGNAWGSRLFAYLSPTDAFIAINGKDRFEPGSMFRSRPGEERVRQMFEEVCHSLTVMKQLKAAFG